MNPSRKIVRALISFVSVLLLMLNKRVNHSAAARSCSDRLSSGVLAGQQSEKSGGSVLKNRNACLQLVP
jgi:hypothetical protein